MKKILEFVDKFIQVIGLKNWYENTKIKTKLSVSYSVLLSVTIAAIAALSYVRINTVILNLAKKEIRYSVLQLEENITNRLENYEEISKSVFFNKELIGLITKKYDKRLDAYDGFKRCKEILETIKFIDPVISVISVKAFNESFLYDGEFFQLINEKNELYNELIHDKQNIYIKIDQLWKSTYKNWKNQDVIGFYKLLYEYKKDFHIAGILKIEIPETVIYEFIKAESNTKDIYITDQDWNVITASDRTIIGENISKLPYIQKVLKEDMGEFIFQDDGDSFLAVYTTIYNQWKIVYITHLESLMTDTTKINNFILLICIISICGLWILNRILARKLTQRIELLKEGVLKVGQGDYDNKIELTGNDEVGQLAASYNQMTQNLKYMFKEVYEANLTRKQAELWALQAQINPHFLYNALSSFGWLALKKGMPELRHAAMDLAKFYRFSLSSGTDIIPLKQEIEHIRTYVKIQNLRFENKVRVSYKIEDVLYDYNIMKLTLQPLVENCYNHAMKDDDSILNIEILGYIKDNYVMLEVIDDGIGMDEEESIHLLEGNRKKDNQKSGYGIANVDARIKLQFGQEYGVSINSMYGIGTIVSLLLPYNNK